MPEHGGPLREHDPEEVLLAGEVVADSALGRPGLGGDIVDRRLAVAAARGTAAGGPAFRT